jgi:hypothetical protein
MINQPSDDELMKASAGFGSPAETFKTMREQAYRGARAIVEEHIPDAAPETKEALIALWDHKALATAYGILDEVFNRMVITKLESRS